MNARAPGDWSFGRARFRLIMVLLARTALAHAAAPFFAFRAVNAARDGDRYTLAQLVDYAAMRQGGAPG